MSSSDYTTEHKALLDKTPARYTQLRDNLNMTNAELCNSINAELPKVGGPLKSITPLSLARKILKLDKNGISPAALKQLLECLDRIQKTPTSATRTLESNHITSESSVSAVGNSTRSKLRMVVSELPETILPHSFRLLYQANLDIDIQTQKHWGNFGELFAHNKTDVVVHSFSTVLAHNQCNSNDPLLFFPLLAFKAYDVVVGTASLGTFAKKTPGLQEDYDLNSWQMEQLRSLLRSTKALVERGTDLEWFYAQVCLEYGFKPEDLENEIIIEHALVRDAQKALLNSRSKALILPTNKMTIAALLDQKPQVVTRLQHKVKHWNYDGFVCTDSFYRSHVKELTRMIESWFMSVHILAEVWKEEDQTKSEFGIFNTNGLLVELQRLSGYKNLSYKDMKNIYTKHSEYFKDYLGAAHSFRTHVLGEGTMKTNHEGIAQVLLDHEVREGRRSEKVCIRTDWVEPFRKRFDEVTQEVETHLMR